MCGEPDSTLARPAICVVLVNVLAVALTCGAVIWAADLFRVVGLVFYTEQYLTAMLAIALPLVFLAVPAGRGKERIGGVPWYDRLAALTGCTTAVYATIRFPVLTELTTLRPVDGMVVAVVMVVLLIEGLRRTTGRILPLVVLVAILFALIGEHIPGVLQGRPITVEKVVYYLGWDASAILGIPMRIVTTIVIIFLLFGELLHKTGGSGFFTDIAVALMGRYRGGPAKIAIFASSLFGSISGSVVSNVVTTGVITIPLMRKGGYQPHLAGAIEAVASTGGQLMPPVMGAAAFLMAEFLAVPYAEVAIAALIPAVLYYVALFIQADLEAARAGLQPVEPAAIPRAWPVLRDGWFFPLPFAALIYAMFWLNYLPETAALLAVGVVIVCSVLFGFRGQRMTASDLYQAVRRAGLQSLDIIMIGAAAGMVVGVLYLSGLSFGLSLALGQWAGGNVFVLLLMAGAVCIVLGMGMPTVGVYVLLATLVAPALVKLGVPQMAAHMFILYYGMMSMITPPVAIGAFAAASLSGADPMRTGFAAMRFGWTAFVIPFLFVYSPALLMQGRWFTVLLVFVTAVVGVWGICVGLIGYSFRRLGPTMRLVYGSVGVLLLLPHSLFPGAIWTDIAGAALCAALIALEIVLARRPAVPRPLPERSL